LVQTKEGAGDARCGRVTAEFGHGKRNKVLSDYTFAVRDEATVNYCHCKAYSGLTDGEIAELPSISSKHTSQIMADIVK
jgi:DNA ligase-1